MKEAKKEEEEEEETMSKSGMMAALAAMLLGCAAAANELDVNEADWAQLSDAEKQAIQTILRDSRLVQDPVIVTKKDTPRLGGDARAGEDARLLGILRPIASFACRRGCEATAIAAVTACTTLTAAVAGPVCISLAHKGEDVCKRACR